MKNGFILPSLNQDLYFHHVKSGENLSGIISEYFHVDRNTIQGYIQQALKDNPDIKNPDFIRPSQLIVLRTDNAKMCTAAIDMKQIGQVKSLWKTMDIGTQKAIKQTSPIYSGLSLGLAGGGSAMFTLDKTLASNMSLLNGIPDAYHDYKQGNITKYQFDKIRKAKLNSYTNNIGPAIHKIIYDDNKIKDSFNLKPGRSLNATKSMMQHMGKLKSISKAASTGGIILSGVGLAANCYQISQTETLTEKNEIAVKAISSTVSGVFIGSIATILLVGTPVGWGIILTVSVGSAIASFGAGEFAGSIYKSQFSNTDIVNSLGINKFCN